MANQQHHSESPGLGNRRQRGAVFILTLGLVLRYAGVGTLQEGEQIE